MPRSTTAEFCTELNLKGSGCSVARRRFHTIHQLILQKCQESNMLSCRQASDTLWGQVRTEAIRHTTLEGFQAKFHPPYNGSYQAFHLALESLIVDLVNKTTDPRRNARLNSNNKQDEVADGAGSRSEYGSWGEGAIPRPQQTLHEKRRV